MNSMSKERLVELLRRIARENGGQPPGDPRFFRETKLTKNALWDVGIRSYGDLCELAGFPRNRFKQRKTPDQLFEPLAILTAKLQRFPDDTDRRMAHRQDATFPSQTAFLTAQREKGPLDHQLFEWCRLRPEHSLANEIVQSHLSWQSERPKRHKAGRAVNGYIYLMRYGSSGRDYKLGMTEQVSRRHTQIAGMSPYDVRLVHVIETDDPAGIERYWKRRFESKRLQDKDEIFRLLPEDVIAFKWRKYQ
jgi:hypothetical protein